MSNIDIEVNGQFVNKNTKNAGSAGVSNTTSVKVSFDDEWTGFAKRIIWLDSKGENKTSVLLVPEISNGTTVYETYIPSEVTKEEGWCSFCIEGYYDSNPEKILKSVSDKLFVSYSHTNKAA